MQKFKFRAIERRTKYIEVEAETKEEAIDLADEIMEAGEIDFDKNMNHYEVEIELV